MFVSHIVNNYFANTSPDPEKVYILRMAISTSVTNNLSWLVFRIHLLLQTGSLCFGLCGPHQCSADTGAYTWQKQALSHMPGWLTLPVLHVQTPGHARVLKPPVNSCALIKKIRLLGSVCMKLSKYVIQKHASPLGIVMVTNGVRIR